jgi:hypothetical protein
MVLTCIRCNSASAQCIFNWKLSVTGHKYLWVTSSSKNNWQVESNSPETPTIVRQLPFVYVKEELHVLLVVKYAGCVGFVFVGHCLCCKYVEHCLISSQYSSRLVLLSHSVPKLRNHQCDDNQL